MRGLYSLGPHKGHLEALRTGTRFSKVPIVDVLAKSLFLVMWSVSITDSSLTKVVSFKWYNNSHTFNGKIEIGLY